MLLLLLLLLLLLPCPALSTLDCLHMHIRLADRNHLSGPNPPIAALVGCPAASKVPRGTGVPNGCRVS